MYIIQIFLTFFSICIAGWIADVTGKYELQFYLCGTLTTLGGLLMALLPFIAKCKGKKNTYDFTQQLDKNYNISTVSHIAQRQI